MPAWKAVTHNLWETAQVERMTLIKLSELLVLVSFSLSFPFALLGFTLTILIAEVPTIYWLVHMLAAVVASVAVAVAIFLRVTMYMIISSKKELEYKNDYLSNTIPRN